MLDRQVELFMKLCMSEGYLPAVYFAEEFQVSTKTIYKDIDVLLPVVRDAGLSIEKKPRVGIKLLGTYQSKKRLINQLSQSILEKSDQHGVSTSTRRMSIAKSILLDSCKLTLKEMASQWIVSKSSILSDIDDINKSILTSDTTITSDGKAFLCNANEEDRQVAATTFILETSKSRSVKDWYDGQELKGVFPQKILSIIQQIFKASDKNWLNGIPEYYQCSIYILILVQVYRASIGYHFDGYLEEKSNSNTFQIAKKVLKFVGKSLGVEFNVSDFGRLARNLSAYRIDPTIREDQMEWSRIVSILIRRMRLLQNVVYIDEKRLAKQLEYHIPAMIQRLREGLVVKNPLLNEIRAQYPDLFGETWYALSFLEKQFNLVLTDDEVSFVTIYFHMAVTGIGEKKRVLVVFDQYSSFTDFIIQRIRQVLPTDIRINSTDLVQYQGKDGEADLVVGINTPSLVTRDPYVIISPLFDERDQASLLSAYVEKVLNPLISEPEKPMHLLRNITIPKNIFLNMNLKSRDDALNFLIDRLEKRNEVSPEFRTSLFRREKIGSTEVGNGVAMPHAAPECVKKTTIMFLTLSRPIRWYSSNVSLVILLCVPNDNINCFHKLVKNVYQLIRSKKSVHRILSMTDANELIEYIVR